MKHFKGTLVFEHRTFDDIDVYLEEIVRGPDEVGLSEWGGRMSLPEQARALIVLSDPPRLKLSDGRSGQILVASMRSDSGEVLFQGSGELKGESR